MRIQNQFGNEYCNLQNTVFNIIACNYFYLDIIMIGY